MAGLTSKKSPCLEERNSMRSRRLSILVPCLLIAIVLVFIFLHAHHRHESVAAEPSSPPTVAVIAARVGTIANQLSVAGIFQPFQDVDVHGEVSGYIRHIYVDIGDRVHEGQTLAVLEVPELDAEVAVDAPIESSKYRHHLDYGTCRFKNL
jgi:multidrug efflux pump subunit AcrA (membrane-fusion protein)